MLVKETLAEEIKAAFDAESDKKVKPAEARQRMAERIAAAIDSYVKAGVVNVTVATTGTAVAQSGTGTGTIS